jgi:hypothetical protein
MTSKLTGSFLGLLLIVAAGVTSMAQTSPKVTPIDKKPAAEKEIEGVKKSVATNDAPQYQELRCRGGGLRFVVVAGRTTSSGDQTMYMTIDFQHAAQAAGLVGRSLQPGQCAFVDRSLRADEPEQIFQEIVSFGQLKEKLHGSAVDSSPTAAERYPDSKNVPQYLSDAKHYWSFFVRQNGPLPAGRFECSYGRYWKPGADPARPVDSTRAKRDNSDVLTLKPDNKNVVVTGQVGSAPTKLNAKLVNDGNYFQLICRGGPGLRFDKSDNRPNPDPNQFSADSPITTMIVNFQHSTQPAHSGRNLQPGQCSPAEFTLRDTDPAQVQADVPVNGQSNGQGLPEGRDGLPVDRSPIIAERYPDVFNISEYLKDPNRYWAFIAEDSGKGYFADAGTGHYWKPEFYKGPQVRPFDQRKKANDIPSVIPKKP